MYAYAHNHFCHTDNELMGIVIITWNVYVQIIIHISTISETEKKNIQIAYTIYSINNIGDQN